MLIKPGCTKQLSLYYVGDVALLSDFRQGSNIMRFFFPLCNVPSIPMNIYNFIYI